MRPVRRRPGRSYLDANVDYNRSQFELFVALGQPPAATLAHPVPTEGIAPSGIPGAVAPNRAMTPAPAVPPPANPPAANPPAAAGIPVGALPNISALGANRR